MDTMEHIAAPPSPDGAARGNLGRLFGEDAEFGIDLIEIRNVLRRRKSVIVACIVLITSLAAAYVSQITPRYTAEASIMLDPREMHVVDVKQVMPELPISDDAAVVRSEVEVLKSATIAADVVKKLNLTENPEFNGRLVPPTPYERAMSWLRSLVGMEAHASLGDQPTQTDAASADLLDTTKALMGATDVVNDGRSYILKVRVTSKDPKLAAHIADAYADSYLFEQLDSKFEAVRRANAWLSDHLTDLREKVEASDRAVQQFRASHNMIQTNGSTVANQQVTELSTQLILAKSDLAQKQSNLAELESEIKHGGVTAAAQVLNSPLIQQLRKQETDLLAQQAQLATRYKPAHPAMINIKAQIDDLNQKIQQEIDKVVRSLEGEVAATRAKEEALDSSLKSLQTSAGQQDEAVVQLHELERQAEANRALYENFLNRFGQTSSQSDMQQADARIIANAVVPTSPSYPRKGLAIELAFAGSIIIGVLAALGVERLDHGFRTSDQFEKLAQVPVLGLSPDFDTDIKPQDAVIDRPVSSYAEAIRTIRTSLRYSDVDDPPKVVAVTSAVSEEGKSVFSLSLARSVARSGRKALIIDCDLRRPSLRRLLNVDGDPGILQVFEEHAKIDNAIRIEESSGLHYMTSSPGTPNPQDVLGSNRMRAALAALRQHYDMIVLDTPPTLAVSDAVVLSHLVDTTIFLVRWGRTPRTVALGAIRNFRANGGTLAGVVLSRVDYRKHAHYYYGDTGYYYGYYGKRYGSDKYGSYGES